MAKLSGKTAIITGGGSGLGEASSELLAAEGARVLVSDINEEAAARTADIVRQKGGSAISLAHDVTNQDEWQHVVQTTVKEFGSFDILVNNAGVSGTPPGVLMEDVDFEDWRQVMSVNLDSVFLGCQEAIRSMRDSGGSIINISSIMGIVGGAGAAYNASKGGVRLLTKSVAVYCGNNGYPIRCNSIHPGYIWTSMVRTALEYFPEIETEEELRTMLIERHPIGRLGIPDDIANGVLFLASEASGFMTGSELVIDGGYTAV